MTVIPSSYAPKNRCFPPEHRNYERNCIIPTIYQTDAVTAAHIFACQPRTCSFAGHFSVIHENGIRMLYSFGFDGPTELHATWFSATTRNAAGIPILINTYCDRSKEPLANMWVIFMSYCFWLMGYQLLRVHGMLHIASNVWIIDTLSIAHCGCVRLGQCITQNIL